MKRVYQIRRGYLGEVREISEHKTVVSKAADKKSFQSHFKALSEMFLLTPVQDISLE